MPKPPNITAYVELGDDGNPSFTVKTDRIKTIQDLELLFAGMMNGIEMQVGHIAEHEGMDVEAMKARIMTMVQIMAKDNNNSPQRFVAKQQDDDADDSEPDQERPLER